MFSIYFSHQTPAYNATSMHVCAQSEFYQIDKNVQSYHWAIYIAWNILYYVAIKDVS